MEYLRADIICPSIIKMESEQVETMKARRTLQPLSGVKPAEMTKNLSTSSKSEVIGSFIGMGIVGFWFEIGVMLAVKTIWKSLSEDNKMAEENQVMKEPQQVQQEPQQVIL